MNTETIEEVKLDEKIERTVIDPGKYNVVFLNDNQTPMEFVIEVLIGIFKHSRETSEKITLDVHTNGSAVVGTYSFEIAEQKGTEATLAARNAGFPLNIRVEKA